MGDVSVSVNDILTFASVLTALTVIVGVYTKIKAKYSAPYEQMKAVNDEQRKQIERLEEQLNKHAEFLDSDNKKIKGIMETNAMICKALFTLINHEITGNGIEGMKTMQKELQEFLIMHNEVH